MSEASNGNDDKVSLIHYNDNNSEILSESTMENICDENKNINSLPLSNFQIEEYSYSEKIHNNDLSLGMKADDNLPSLELRSELTVNKKCSEIQCNNSLLLSELKTTNMCDENQNTEGCQLSELVHSPHNQTNNDNLSLSELTMNTKLSYNDILPLSKLETEDNFSVKQTNSLPLSALVTDVHNQHRKEFKRDCSLLSELAGHENYNEDLHKDYEAAIPSLYVDERLINKENSIDIFMHKAEEKPQNMYEEKCNADEENVAFEIHGTLGDLEGDQLQVHTLTTPYGIIINFMVLLLEQEWHTITGDSILECFVCDIEVIIIADHILSLEHIDNLNIYGPLVKYDSSIVRKRDNKYHCGVCNEIIVASHLNEHFDTITHQNNNLFAVNRVFDVMYEFDNGTNQLQDIGDNGAVIGYHDTDTGISETSSDLDDMEGFYDYDFDFNKPASYATMARKPRPPKYILVNVDGASVHVSYEAWHMVLSLKSNTMYCMACKKSDNLTNKAAHCSSDEHMENLAKCSLVSGYSGYLIRKVDSINHHCAHCNRLAFASEIQNHILEKHAKINTNKNETENLEKSQVTKQMTPKKKYKDQEMKNIPQAQCSKSSTLANLSTQNLQSVAKRNVQQSYVPENEPRKHGLQNILQSSRPQSPQVQMYGNQNIPRSPRSQSPQVQHFPIPQNVQHFPIPQNVPHSSVPENVPQNDSHQNIPQSNRSQSPQVQHFPIPQNVPQIYGSQNIPRSPRSQSPQVQHFPTPQNVPQPFVSENVPHMYGFQNIPESPGPTNVNVPQNISKTNKYQNVPQMQIPQNVPQQFNSNENNLFKKITIFVFNHKLTLPLINCNIVCRSENNMFYCGICNYTCSGRQMVLHINKQRNHIDNLQKIQFDAVFGIHLIRHIKIGIHCGICNHIINRQDLLAHVGNDETHKLLLNIAIGNANVKSIGSAKPEEEKDENQSKVYNNPKENVHTSTNKSNDVKTTETDQHKALRNQSKVETDSKTNYNKTSNPNDIKRNEAEQHKVEIAARNQANVENINKNPNKMENINKNQSKVENINKNQAKVENIIKNPTKVENMNKNQAKVNNILECSSNVDKIESKEDYTHKNVPKVTNDGENKEESDSVEDRELFDRNEYVYIRLNKFIAKISILSYNALVHVGDGTRYCIICDFKLVNLNSYLKKHIHSKSHIDNLQKYKYVENYEEHYLRQFYLQYHCSICNVMVKKRDLKKHLSWQPHLNSKEVCSKLTKKNKKRDFKLGINQIDMQCQREIIHLNAKETEIKLIGHYVFGDIEKKNRKGKIIIIDSSVLKIDWESWHCVKLVAGKWICHLCRRIMDSEELDHHVEDKKHLELCENIDKRYLPHLLRKVPAVFNCATCNEIVGTFNVLFHLDSKIHIDKYECIKANSAALETYQDCCEDVLTLETEET